MQEWAGKTSSKFGRTRRSIILSPLHDSVQGLYGSVDAGIQRIKGRRHFSITESEGYYNWKPCFKKSDVKHFIKKPSRVKWIREEYSKSREKSERRHILSSRQPIIQEVFNECIPIKQSSTYVLNNRIW